jgi:hypothetical protein
VAALTTARKKTAAREAKKAYEKRKTRAAKVTATREQAAADAEVGPVARQVASVDVAPLRGRRSLLLDEG